MNDESQTDSLAGVTKVSEMRSIAQIDLAEFDAVDVLVTEKLDGTSVRVGFTSGQAWCGGHNHILTVGEKHRYDGFGWGIYVSETGLIDKVTKHAEQRGADFAIYGEFCGPKIQKNLYRLDETELFVFDMRSQGKTLPWEQVVE